MSWAFIDVLRVEVGNGGSFYAGHCTDCEQLQQAASPKRQDFGAEVTCSHTIAADEPAVSRQAAIRQVMARGVGLAVVMWSSVTSLINR